ncbi:hypothetical protein VHEMI00061 [[Torrubiella] hemipterigena]|uniref:Uncharacterized protein n=1 Tax=[Torrubiella] hemipterigena TaxID=1531966 RepID=A0A0A1T147_9HYPO|nr:hypothetical protein VHEMI00061 [[Torrubiella] hemipterigena]
MGNDGGSIPRRHELVKNAARAPTSSELKAAVLESLGHAWAHCALSGDTLDKDAVVSDGKGRLYNYESVLKGLMPSDEPSADITPAALGIRSLRDVAKVKFSINGNKWVCPISMKEMGPATKSVYLIPCGHAFAEIAITEIKEQTCPECAEPYTEENVITLLPTTQKEIQRLESRLEGLKAKGLTHTLKKDKSEKKKKRKGDEANTDDAAATETVKKAKKEVDPRLNGINNPMTASLTAKVMAEQEERNKQRKLAALRSEKAR